VALIPNLFVFTAGDPTARQHLKDTIARPIDPDRIRRHLDPGQMRELTDKTPDGRFFAWGATPGSGNVRTWGAMQEGDWVLVYFQFRYHYVSRVTLKLRSRELAEELWGTNASGQTWEYMYFLEEPQEASLDSRSFADVSLPARYQGFMKVASAIPGIVDQYGGLDQFMAARILNSTPPPPTPQPEVPIADVQKRFAAALDGAGFWFDRGVVNALLASLMTKPFVILTGLSGSGKSQIALQLGKWFGEDRYLAAAVRPDWTGPEALMGYPDLLQKPEADGRRQWVTTEVLSFVLRAGQHEDMPHLLLLDEMNLAHVERYFADFLSGMESGEPVVPNLVNEGGRWVGQVDGERLVIPKNLFVVGTVNVDETTYMFSPKVLDRANTIEFRVATAALRKAKAKPSDVEPAPPGELMTFLAAATEDMWQVGHPAPFEKEFEDAAIRLHSILMGVGWEFGFRTFRDMIRYAAIACAMAGLGCEEVLDQQLMQKILPRLHGSRRRLETPLKRLARFCVDPWSTDSDTSEVKSTGSGIDASESARLPRSHDKLRRMFQALEANQFASFND
jgi:5-methylcytosine-specific restriction protein B